MTLLASAVLGTGAASSTAHALPPTPVVRLPFPQDDGSLTPYTFELGYPLVTLVYDTLMWRDASGVPQPWLAKSVATRPDAKQVTISLVDGVHWHDGVALTAADVVFTFRYVASHFHPRFTPELAPVEGVEAIDPLTVVVHLRQAWPGFSDQPLADLPILPSHLWQGLRPGEVAPPGLPVGSGPYRLVEHRPNQDYRFEANSDYFQGPPAVQSIQVPIIGDSGATLRAFQSGAVDALPESLDGKEAAALHQLGTRVVTGASFLGTVVMFDVRQPPFNRIEVRQAVSEALDLGVFAAAAGDAVPADHGYLHPRSAWASPEVLHRYDALDARRRLAALHLGPLTVLAPDNEPLKLGAAQQVALALGRVGVAASVVTVSPKQLSKAVGDDGSAPDFQAAIWSAPALASYDPTLLGRLFSSRAGSSLDYPGYSSPAFDAAAARVATTTDAAARRSAVGDALRVLATDVPVVALFYPAGIYAFHPSAYDGWVFVNGTGILDKRSFVGRPPAASAPSVASGGTPAGGGRGSSLLVYIWFGIIGAAVVVGLALAGLHIADRRQPNRR